MMYNEIDYNELKEPRRLHPATIIFEVFKLIKESILGFGIGLIVALQESFTFFLLFAVIFLLVVIIYSIVSWARFTYWVDGDELRIEQGVFVRKKRYLSVNRIHKIDLTANVIHRLFKLVQVQIDSASSSGGAEVNLSAVKLQDAKQLRDALQKKKVIVDADTGEGEAEAGNITQSISWKRLFIAGSTSGSAGFIILAVLTLFSQIEELIPRSAFTKVYSWVIELSLFLFVATLIVLALLLWIFGIAGTMIRYGHFTIEKRKNELFIKRGLLETKELTIPFDRIQAIGIEQSPIRQPLGYVRIFAVVAGGSFDKLESYPVLFPLMHEKEVDTFLHTFLREFKVLSELELQAVSKKGLKYYIVNLAILPILAAIPFIYFLPAYFWIPLIIVALCIAFGWLQYKNAKFNVTDTFIIIQKRRLQKVKIIANKRRIQAFEKSQHRLQKYDKLASIKVSLLGSEGFGTHYTVKHLSSEDAIKLADWYSYRNK